MCAVFPCNEKAASDRRKFEPNTAISGKQSYLSAYILYLSTRDRCGLFRCCALSVPCSLGRSSRNRTSSLSVSLGLGIRPVAFCHRPSFCLEYRLSPSKTLRLRYGAIMDGA